jgi:hypothetical protein
MVLLLRDLEGAMRLERNKDISVHVSTCSDYDFNTLASSYVEVVYLIRCVLFQFRRKV